MKVHLPDNVIRYMVKKGYGPEDAQVVHMAVSFPAETRVLDNGMTRFDGYGATVIGKVDSTGKHVTISKVMVDKRD